MDLHDFLSRLSGVKAKSDGEYICKCPAHDDRTASLCVRDGEKGIVLKCQAGCPTEAVLTRMGLKMSDLFCEPRQQRERRSAPRGRGTDPAATPKPSAPLQNALVPTSQGEKTIEFVCSYDYRDEEGKLLFQACRYIDRSTGKKTFRLRQPEPDGSGRWKYSKKGVRMVLYRLPEMLDAIRTGRPIYIVEGEKDVDNLKKLGRVATTNAMGAGKWDPSYGESFTGAQSVYIIPDNDDVGREHAMAAARNVMLYAAEIKILDLTKVCPELPAKGDVTDFYKLLGREKGDSALDRLIVETERYNGDDRSEYERAIDCYNQIFGYCVDAGRICQGSPDGAKPLSTFIALPKAVVTCDDGASETKMMVIDGWRADGMPLPRIMIKANTFTNMAWVGENWGFDANIMPGNATRDRLRYVISAVGQNTARKITEYNHTGWRKIGGRWAYLYQGGAIGADGVTVALDSGLSRYRLDGSGANGFNEIEYADAASITMQFRTVMSEVIAVPLLGTVFLAPLREFLDQTGVGPSFSLFLLGSSGCHKSTVAALALSHYGDFTYKSLPASFNDTGNSIRRKAFLLKDVPIVVDDYHPVGSLQERKEMERTAQSLSRAFGDGADRGRLGSNMVLQRPMPPRGVAIISGEDTPDITQSGLARYFIVTVNKGDVEANMTLTELQELARDGYLQRCMQGYIKWLLAQADELPNKLHEMFIAHRVKAAAMVPGQHARSPEAIAHVMIGYELMLNYMRDIGLLTTEECRAESDRAWKLVVLNSQRQATDMQDERPSRMFLSSLAELLATHAVNVRDLQTAGASTPKDMIGYADAMFYYMLPNAAYRAVARLCADQGRAFPLTMKALYKQLREDGVITSETSDKSGTATKGKRVDGRTLRLLWIPRVEIDGRKEVQEQTRMVFGGASEGFVETDEPLPDGFKE